MEDFLKLFLGLNLSNILRANQVLSSENFNENLKERISTDWSINVKIQIQNLQLLEPIFAQKLTLF